jgi:hypothetical protein
MDLCNALDIPVGPILSMKEIAEEPSLRDTGTVVEVEHPERGKYLTVGNPVKLSDSPCEVKYAPLLGEHTEEVLTRVLGYSAKEVPTSKRLARSLCASCHGQQAFGRRCWTRCEARRECRRRVCAPENPAEAGPVEGRAGGGLPLFNPRRIGSRTCGRSSAS